MRAKLTITSEVNKWAGIRVPWASTDPKLLWAELYFDHNRDIVRSSAPVLAFELLPPGGWVLLAAVADADSEHLEAVRTMKAEGLPYRESSHVSWRSRPSSLFLRKEKVTKPLLLASINRRDVLEKMFRLYNSWLYALEFLLLGTVTEPAKWVLHMEHLGSTSDSNIPRELIDENQYLMITVQEHGSLFITNKFSRSQLENVCRLVCSRLGFNLELV